MTKRKRRRFSPEEKVSILRRHLLDGLPVSDVCDEHGLHPNQFYTWQKQFLDRGAATFTPDKTNAVERKRQKQLDALQSKLARKDAVIAEISEEYVQLKKELGEL